MKTVFVDTNVFLRFFTLDDEGQHDQAAQLFKMADEELCQLLTGPPVLFEIAWTLRAAYDQPKEKVIEVLSAIAALKNLRLTDADLVEEAIARARSSNQEFADAYLSALAKSAGAEEIATFNRKHFEGLGDRVFSF